MGITKSIAATVLATCAMLASAHAQARPAHKSHQQPSAEDDRAADALKEAESLLQKQQYSQAEEKLQALVATQAENPQAWFDLGFAQSHQGKTTEAIAAYKKTVALSPKWFEAQQNLGLALAKSGDFTAAAAALKIAVTLKPTTGGQQALAAAWLSLAQITEESAPQDSLAAYQKAAELDPTNSEAQLGAARNAEHSGNFAAAEQQYLKLAAAGNNDSIERLISFYLKQKRFSDAETWLHKYISANPQSTAAQLQLGKVQAAEGKTQGAIATLEPLYQAAPDPKLARDLASLYLETKQYPAAANLLRSLIAQSPTDAQLHLDYGTALMHQLKYAEAQTVLLKAVQLNPNNVQAYSDLAYAADQNKNYELTIRVLDARVKLQPETPATYFLRATAYDNLRMYKPAAANYKLFLGVAGGKFPDQEFQARHRLKAILPN
jgi:tetratricopeptide (TPR) repeat protein